MQTALVAGGLLAFGLSFDEIIVTTFTAGAGEQTLPLWIFTNFSRPNQLPIVNVVAVLVILISIIPVYLAHKLTRDEGGAAPTGGRGASGGGRGDAAERPRRPPASARSACAVRSAAAPVAGPVQHRERRARVMSTKKIRPAAPSQIAGSLTESSSRRLPR